MKIEGTLKNEKLFVDSIERITKNNLPPWPHTLGEQKYVVVFLLNESEMETFNATNFTNIVFELANGWIEETSYGKANVSGNLIFSLVIPPDISDPTSMMNYALEETDPFFNFNDYDGIVLYHPQCEGCYFSGMASIGKSEYFGDNYGAKFFRIWLNRKYEKNPYDYSTLVHEMGIILA